MDSHETWPAQLTLVRVSSRTAYNQSTYPTTFTTAIGGDVYDVHQGILATPQFTAQYIYDFGQV